jgi:hypothetical protein
MRRIALALAAASLALTAVGLAHATSRFSATFDLSYLTREPAAPAGQALLATWSDPGAAARVPKTIKRIDLTFHRGTRFDTSALARCRASDAEVRSKGVSACPVGSRLGSGHTNAVTATGDRFTTDVTLFNARGQIIVLVALNGTPVTEFRDIVEGRTIKIEPVLPPGVSLEQLKIRIGRHSKGHGAGQKTYMRAPPTCPASRRWTTAARFTYVDGSSQTLHSASPCRRG